MKTIMSQFLIPLTNGSFNPNWVEEIDDEVGICQLYSEDWVGCRIENGKVIGAILWRTEDRDMIINGEEDSRIFYIFEDILDGQKIISECIEDAFSDDWSYKDAIYRLLTI